MFRNVSIVSDFFEKQEMRTFNKDACTARCTYCNESDRLRKDMMELGITNANKEVDAKKIDCGDTFG